MSQHPTRNIIVHYHIFKNAGSTFDHILKNNFGSSWMAFDGEHAHSRILPQDLEKFISTHPDAKAISSHNAILPLPNIPGALIAPILFLRHPIDRVRSIYDFERRQGLTSGPVSRGADHASRLSFEDYIQWRLDTSKNGVTHNFHTAWLLHNLRFNRFEILQKDYEQALHTLSTLPFFGLVERFDDSLKLLKSYLGKLGMPIDLAYQVKNSSKHHDKPLETRLAELRRSIGEETWNKIESRNQWDMRLYEAATSLFQARYTNR